MEWEYSWLRGVTADLITVRTPSEYSLNANKTTRIWGLNLMGSGSAWKAVRSAIAGYGSRPSSPARIFVMKQVAIDACGFDMGEAESNLVTHEYVSPWRLIMKEFSGELE